MKHVVLPILVVGVLPFLLTLASKAKGFTPADNQQTRVWQSQLTGWRQRAFWAHQNGFEAFPLFAALVVCAYLGQPASHVAALAAWSYVGLRLLYSACYLADIGRVRSFVWLSSHAAQVVLVLVALSVV